MKRLIPLLAVLLIAFSCDRFHAATYQDDMVMPLQGARDSLHFKVSIQYASSGMLIPAMEKMNAAIVTRAFDLEGGENGSLEETASQYRENLIDEYITENEGLVGQMPVLTWEDYTIGEFGEKYRDWRNYSISYYCYRGGAHGYSTLSLIVFDRKSGEVITEDSLFADGWLAPVSALMQERVMEELQEEVREFVQKEGIVPNANFSVSEDGVEWLFQPDDILPHAFGPLTVTLSWKELKPYLR